MITTNFSTTKNIEGINSLIENIYILVFNILNIILLCYIFIKITEIYKDIN